jgi:hypothetical protein
MIHKKYPDRLSTNNCSQNNLVKKWQAVSPKVAALEEKRDEPLFIILDKNSKCFYGAENDYLTERFLLLLTQRNGY